MDFRVTGVTLEVWSSRKPDPPRGVLHTESELLEIGITRKNVNPKGLDRDAPSAEIRTAEIRPEDREVER